MNMTAEKISDHAVLRFLERAYHLGPLIDAAREEMVSGLMPAIDFGAPVVLIHGCRMVIRGGVVVTVLPKADCPRAKAGPHRRAEKSNQKQGW